MLILKELHVVSFITLLSLLNCSQQYTTVVSPEPIITFQQSIIGKTEDLDTPFTSGSYKRGLRRNSQTSSKQQCECS